MGPTLLNPETFRRSIWKNGLGHTDEIAIFPPTAELKLGNFLWRISSAKIERDSPFSVFPDHDRSLVILKGSGVKLTHAFEEGIEETFDVLPFEPYDFPGEILSRCELISGAVQDLSVFVRKGEVESMISVFELREGEDFNWVPLGKWNFAIAATGDFEIEDSKMPERWAARVERVCIPSSESNEDPILIRSLTGQGRIVSISLNASQ